MTNKQMVNIAQILIFLTGFRLIQKVTWLALIGILSLMPSYAISSSKSLDDKMIVSETVSGVVANNYDDEPTILVRGFYVGKKLDLFWSEDPVNRAKLLSKHLAKLFTLNQIRFGNVTITFDPFVNGQDALITNLLVYPATIDGNRAHVLVRFRNFDTDNVMLYSFIREADSWKLDEIASVGGETRWLLTDVLINP